MGAAASLSAAGLPERMSRADVQQLCDKKYTDAQFEAICDSEGFITPQQFVEQVVLEQEEECRRLFVSFCRHDSVGRNTEEMDEEHLISFLRHCKLLSKSQFSIHDARKMFHKLIEEKVEARDDAVHVVTEMDDKGEVQKHVYVTYPMFREQLLPVLAEKKELPMDRVMFLLSRCEANTRLISGELVVTDTYDPADKADTSVERNVKLLVNEKEEEEREKNRKLSDASRQLAERQAKASQVIQNVARKRQSKKRRDDYKLIRQESNRLIDDSCFCNEIYDDELEAKVKAKYLMFAASRSEEMDCKQFNSWLVACGWYIANKNFTKRNAEMVFKKAIARASVLSAGLDLNLGVVMHKRVRYIVLRRAIIKVLAEEINVNTNDVMFTLLDVDEP